MKRPKVNRIEVRIAHFKNTKTSRAADFIIFQMLVSRVDGMMMNSHLFNEVFKCPIGSRMNPPEKCAVWT